MDAALFGSKTLSLGGAHRRKRLLATQSAQGVYRGYLPELRSAGARYMCQSLTILDKIGIG